MRDMGFDDDDGDGDGSEPKDEKKKPIFAHLPVFSSRPTFCPDVRMLGDGHLLPFSVLRP